MKALILCFALLLTGCVVPVKQNFPSVPKTFLEQPKELKEVPANSSFSIMLDIVMDNYGSYYIVSERLIAWQEWYTKNKEIFDKAK
jgi:hypothetical protein